MTINYEIGKPRKDRRMRITLLLCIGKTKKRIKTEFTVTQSELNRKGKIRHDAPIYNILCTGIHNIEIEYGHLDTFLTGEQLSASEAYKRMNYQNIPSFFSYSEKWINRNTIKGLKNYKTAINNFKSFLKGNDLSFSMFSYHLLNEYSYFLKDKPRAQSLYISAIKKIYSDAEKEFGLKPFSSFRFNPPKQKAARNKAIDIDVLKKIFSYDGKTKRAKIAHDCAILSFCLCGTNSVDLFNARIKGNTIIYDRTKTKDRRSDNAHMEIKIPEQIKGLVNKYADGKGFFIFHNLYRNAEDFNKHINIGLKRIGMDLKINFNLTFYSFRHSFASIARNELKIDKYSIHECLCHIDNDTAIDDIYIKKDYRVINDVNQKVTDFVIGIK